MTKVLVQKESDIGKILISNEEGKYNLVDIKFMHNLIDSLRMLDSNKEVRFVIIRGINNFGAGADIGELRRASDNREYATNFFSTMFEMFRTLLNLSKITIANVEGIAYGASMEILLATDFVIASKNSKFAVPGGKIGVFPPVMLTLGKYRLGWNNVLKMAFLGRELNAEEAKQIGLVYEITDNFEDTNANLIRELKQIAPSSLSMMRKILFTEHEKELEKAFQELIDQVLTEDARTGVISFLTKTKPKWAIL
ncbi:enoyl-CoA hydratase/isomerase family protein [Sulfurisphaera ohwakuensis]|uniref:Enoyl-CoA hydratase/carnithine racemase n=1 Tax=Sulfurisphaera ohwakuensis TaxID=69656 RepID=A0A650CEN5_SULOH|nr:enoyl-CoA hydratase/isomerase family protein [Sulfurisphaera ohwakuensis]MBB5252795.1 enoyl-CoA hydratase/carnithine racemase [Sulfurisphaera ohwakuensis]QGR16264.1 enoyl-CoA hydratase/isomerase family protein [Sulfurisphaera ohwakuensis]